MNITKHKTLSNELEELKKETCDKEKKILKEYVVYKKKRKMIIMTCQSPKTMNQIAIFSTRHLNYSTLSMDILISCFSIYCSILDNGHNSMEYGYYSEVQAFDGHSGYVNCVKFSPYHYQYYHRNVICSSSEDGRAFQIFNGHISHIFSHCIFKILLWSIFKQLYLCDWWYVIAFILDQLMKSCLKKNRKSSPQRYTRKPFVISVFLVVFHLTN
ncbi:hypothetical protein RFI_05333 [Reticulomyxa filosa]|uniref:Uncharacterized protein n=1 Tax=Reticulomyxa filosa TaxID=46433 RepID=X6P0N4_RETFI|nr:hypothetical protein RFI_05333 [Reticulomyxa filosa]|eukprot:ETO31786.1 hypothetical protein RFI_05333 [Reticulomyxa filosa]